MDDYGGGPFSPAQFRLDKVGFPRLPLQRGMQIKVEAQSPTLDAGVAGVTTKQWLIYGLDE